MAKINQNEPNSGKMAKFLIYLSKLYSLWGEVLTLIFALKIQAGK